MRDVAIVSAARTPIGNLLGSLSNRTSPDLGAIAVMEAVERAGGVTPDEVFMGCVLQAGIGQNGARQAALNGGIPEDVPAITVNEVCGSGLKACVLAARSIMLGDSDVVVAGGMESMSNAPFVNKEVRSEHKYGDFDYEGELHLVDSMIKDGLWNCFSPHHMGSLCELLNTEKEMGITRKAQDEFALESHSRAVAARKRFKNEIVEVDGVVQDEHPRDDTSLEALSELNPVFEDDGTITAGNASGINDGAAALVFMSADKAEENGLEPLATVEAYSTAYRAPEWYTLAPVDAVRKIEAETERAVADYDLVELNEAYALQTLAVMKELGLTHENVNVNGGAVALGHPIGCSGARILVTLLHEMRRRGSQTGLATLCQGGGGATAMSVVRNG